MNKLKNFFKKLDMLIRHNEILINKILIGFLFLGLITQISSFASILQFRADHRSIVATTDNDSASGIETAERTTLINDNQRRSYGPVWYRINYLMRVWSDNPISDPNRTPQQNKEKDIYFTLMLLSLLSVFSLSGVISFVFFDKLQYQLMSTLILAPTLMNERFQASLVFLAKPDHFLSFILLISFISTVLLINSNFNDKQKKWSAFFWGLTLSTKLTALPFIPVIFLLIFLYKSELKFEFKNSIWFNDCKKFAKYLAISYFLIGFPQNFDFWRNIAYIHNQNKQTSWADWNSLLEWLKIYYEQISKPFLFLSLLLFLFPSRDLIKSYFNKKVVFGSLALFFVPFCYMLSKKISEPFFRWYTFPYVSTGLFLLGCLVVYLLNKIINKNILGYWRLKILNQPYSFLILFFLIPWSLPLASTTLSIVQKELEICRSEALKTESFVDKAVENKEYILADPYVPFSADYEGLWVDSAWEMSPELIIPQKTKWIILKSGYYSMYLPKDEGGTPGLTAHIKNMDKVRTFYRLFWRKNETQDPFNQHWKKIYNDNCGFEVWHQE